jgi:type I restriction enzyme S subunit
LAQSKLWPKGTLCITIAANIAETAILGINACFPDSIVGFAPDPEKADVRYIKYYIDTIKLGMQNISRGTTQDNLSVEKLLSFDLLIPDVLAQRQVADILSAFDDLIENNTRRIKILEQMAKMLYREWFVNLRFPGHEKVKMVDSEIGPIPGGWQIVNFTALSEILSGGTPKTTEPEFWDGEIPFFGPVDAPGGFYVTATKKSITPLGLSRCNSKLYPAETVFITARGTVGKIALPAVAMAMNQSCYALCVRSNLSRLFLFMLTKDCAEQLQQKATGAVFDAITVDTFERLPGC